MNKPRILIPFLFLALFFVACNSSQPSEETKSDDMAQFTEDKEFKDAHETPDSISHSASGKMIQFPVGEDTPGSAYYVQGAADSKKYLFMIHEWWGLNDHIKREADRLAGELSGVHVMALDLYDGKVADNPDDAGKLMNAVEEKRLNEIVKGAIEYAGQDAKIATVGWCFGGGWSLKSSILAGDQGAGCVIYYGMPVQEAKQLVPLKADVLGIFAEKDKWITPEVVNNFEALAKATGKTVQTKQFDADHAFANPSSPRYNEAAAQEANALVLAFLRERLK